MNDFEFCCFSGHTFSWNNSSLIPLLLKILVQVLYRNLKFIECLVILFWCINEDHQV